MILLKPELIQNLATPDGLPAALQQAIELEHATIPTYLYSLYSLKPGHNEDIRQVIRGVVIEEMLHMTLAANILNAIGGAPSIDTPAFIPIYPGPLPGAVEGSLVVHLKRFSVQHVADTFLVIEQPEAPIDFKVTQLLAAAPANVTIGQFYRAIAEQIQAAGNAIFTGNPARQVTGPFPATELIAVHDVDTALRAIDIIVEQGEGTKQTPVDLESDFAHYYRFNEIVKGKYLIRNPHAGPDTPPDEQFIYGGSPITVDAAGIWPVTADPHAANYPAGTAARHACDTFNYTYTSLLKTLHAVFNGLPDQFGASLGLMESLKEQALTMASIDLGNGETAGPSFEYQPVNP